MSRSLVRAALFALFTASGFAGLIYESIWSHYLKLFLGHAAYAQALVLAIFMGGMALGAGVCALRSERWPNLLLAYAGVEAAVGLMALVFHPLFVATTDFAYDTAIPALAGSPLAVGALKWSLAVALILPQSILLGATFPLMSAGILRAHPERAGETIAMLYFTNSLGAAAGVIASGFFLIHAVGLPGTMLTAGLVNCVVALLVWLLVSGMPQAGRAPRPEPPQDAPRPVAALLLTVSLLTGASSFLYEVGWIRMLSMVLGSSTHAFELMLSAFLLGLAFGGLWVRHRIAGFVVPEIALGVVQVVMGLAALATLVVYGRTFEFMKVLLEIVARTEQGYAAFNLGSHFIALLVMFPAAFCAGMTLPLITHALLRRGGGERAIGRVYAANTVGAIAGVFAAVHFALPVLGLKGLITLGAAIDIGLGLVLLWRFAERRWMAACLTTAGGAALVMTMAWVELDSLVMASGVFRHGRLPQPGEAEVLYHRDGKTATVHLVRAGELVSIVTNGKSDAMVAPVFRRDAVGDEPTMVMTGALPLALRPDARTAAVIGIGSGITSHMLLASDAVRELDTIEIEPAMVEAARAFRPRNRAVFQDPRSRVHIEDAKTYFSVHGKRYDIIVSQPSNPWVSGVASLFSDEFYRRVKRSLNPGGLFAQWLQLYDMEPALVASVMKALSRNFSDYEIYATDDSNIIILAADGAPVSLPADAAFRHFRLAAELARLDIHGAADLDVFRLGTRQALQPFFDRYAIAPNSDYFPVLDEGAAKARFMGARARAIIDLGMMPIPAMEFLGVAPQRATPAPLVPHPWLRRSQRMHAAQRGRAYLLDGSAGDLERLPIALRSDFELVRLALRECSVSPRVVSVEQLLAVAGAMVPYLPREDSTDLWAALRASPCARLREPQAGWLALFAAIGARDAEAMARIAESKLRSPEFAASPRRDMLLGAAIIGRLARGERAHAVALWNDFADGVTSEQDNMLPELLQGHLFAPAADR